MEEIETIIMELLVNAGAARSQALTALQLARIEIFNFRLERAVTKQDVYQYGKELLEAAETLRQAQGLDVDYERIADLDGQLLIHDKHEIVVNGGTLMKELGFKPGPDLGRTLKAIENAIVDGKLANDKEAIMAFVQAMK